jgi:L-ascorbate metabolism protein UlaG (beta-lactamase superfamily)
MVITYTGGYCFKISAGDTTVAINPPAAKSSFKVPKFGADVVLIPTEHMDWNGDETASHGSRESFVIRGPGAYEVGDVVITGYASEGSVNQETNNFGNTVYLMHFDGMQVLFLGALSGGKLSSEALSDIAEVDIVFVPVGGETLDAKQAHELVVKLEAKLIIPYAVGKDADLKEFLETEGAKGIKAVEKLTLRAKEVSTMTGDIALLK